MKLMFASDIHGSALYAKQLLARMEEEAPQRLVLLGDLVDHGPRTGLPDGSAPQEVAALLNAVRPRPVCVRGNCEAEVDQMMLEFPVMAEYFPLMLDGHMAFVTHGHIWNEAHLPPLEAGDVLIHGHTHVRAAQKKETYYFLNPGSVSIPKGDGVRGYMVYEDGVFTLKNLDGGVLATLALHG